MEKDKEISVFKQNNITIPISNVNKQDLPKYIDSEVLKERISRITNNRDRMLVIFLWMTGLRISEALNVKRKHVDLNNDTIVIEWLKSRKYHRRHIPIHAQLKQLLSFYLAPFKNEELIFNISRQRAERITKKWLGASPHMLRHSFAVHYLRCGGEVFNLSRLLGHSNIKITAEYLKIVPKDLAKELNTINF